MKRISATLAMIALLGSGAVVAQTPPPPPEQPGQSTMAPSTRESGATTGPSYSQAAPSSTSDRKAQMKSCISQQRASNPQLSEHEAKKACKASLSGASQSK